MLAARRHTRAELMDFAREQYRSRFGHRRPDVRNASALVALGRSRSLLWRGTAYRVAPLSFRAGVRLMVVQQALADAEEADDDEAAGRALRLVPPLVRPLAVPSHRSARLLHRLRPNPFRHATQDERRALLHFLLDVPDDGAVAPAGEAVRVDLVDSLAEFVREMPAWVRDGEPLSWAHYVYGLRHVARARAREDLRAGHAVRVAFGADRDAWRSWNTELRSAGGW